MKHLAIVVLAAVVGGCAAEAGRAGRPAGNQAANHWRVVPLAAGQASGGEAILVDEASGDTWIRSGGNYAWQKMQR